MDKIIAPNASYPSGIGLQYLGGTSQNEGKEAVAAIFDEEFE